MFSNMRHIRAFMSACRASHPAFSSEYLCINYLWDVRHGFLHYSVLPDFEILSLKLKWGGEVRVWRALVQAQNGLNTLKQSLKKDRSHPFSMTWTAGQWTFPWDIPISSWSGREGLALAGGWVSILPGVATGQNLRLISKFITTSPTQGLTSETTHSLFISNSAVGCVVLEMLAVPSRGVLVPFPGQPVNPWETGWR